MAKFIVKKEFVYSGKQYVRGDMFDPDVYSVPAIRVKNLVDANLIVDAAKLTDKQARDLMAQRVAPTAKIPDAQADNSIDPAARRAGKK